MSVFCGLECVLCVGCSRWIWKRCTYIGSDDSATWSLATLDEIEPIPRICRAILAVYEDDLHHPKFLPNGRYNMNPDWIIKRVTYQQTRGQAPPYLIYADHLHHEIVLAVRGLNLAKESDYKLLLNNKLGMQMFDGGYVHHGLLKSAIWLLTQESETLKRLWIESGSRYKMVFAGHSLGSGVVSLLTIVVVNHRDKLGGIPRENVRCYALAPARCMSLNLAVKYADVINSVVLQDDFLPRTPTPLQDIFKSVFCLPCLLFLVCLRDTFMPEGRKLRDPRRLYAPGRMYHIVERKFCRCGRFPPEVRTAIPVEGRFEHIVLSCNATSDHAIIWIEREAQKALERMRGSIDEAVTTAPRVQKFERQLTLEKEHKDALERAVSLNVPHAVTLEEPVTAGKPKEEPTTGREAEEAPATARAAETDPTTAREVEVKPKTAIAAETDPTIAREVEVEPATSIAAETDPTTSREVEVEPGTSIAAETDPTTAREVEVEPATSTAAETDPSSTREQEEKPVTARGAEKERARESEKQPAQNPERVRSHRKSKSSGGSINWDHLVQKLFNKNDSGKLHLKKENPSE